MEGNLAWALAERAALYGWRDRPLFHADEATYTHGQVHDAAARAAAVLHRAGIRRGQRVLIALPDTIGFATALLAAMRLGAVAVLVGPEQAPERHARALSDAEPVAVVCDDGELADRLGASRVHGRPRVLTAADLAGGHGPTPDPEPLPPGAPAYVQYTSGTSGPPKGAVHRHSDPETHFYAMALGALGMGADDVMFSVAKACSPYGLGNTIFFPMFCGAAAILWPDRPTVRGVVRQARRHRPTVLFAVPAFYARLAVALGIGGAAESDRPAFSFLRAAASAAEPLPPSLTDRIETAIGCPLLDGFGTAEVGHTFVSNTVTRRRRGTLGVVLDPYEISVRAEHGGETAIGERGVLHVRGPSVPTEYLGGTGSIGDVQDAQGWLRTGDLVHVDADGFVHHHGRVEDLETVGGDVVTPLEIERVLGAHPAVSEVAVAGRDGEEDALWAFVVLMAGHPPSTALESDLVGLARARLPSPAVPRSVRFVSALPRTPAGKLHRAALRRAPLTEP
ncbi:AMP-binding protein [Actinomadura sp. HBU206391]|uniref:AMP-binding protein n=1 Tax=Actinomadura sp. HBU206391 TaxID=2731692 RepID=UPI00164FF99D|nr:AMP-binding protein [Actinomadura sp. HBU206391]MBC6458251.1 AMP-binding protein [Actinomadura sp. HBU206391]